MKYLSGVGRRSDKCSQMVATMRLKQTAKGPISIAQVTNIFIIRGVALIIRGVALPLHKIIFVGFCSKFTKCRATVHL